MLIHLKELPLCDYLIIGFQLRPCLSIFDPALNGIVQDMIQNNGIYPASLHIRPDRNQEQVKRIIFPTCLQNSECAKREKLASALFKSIGNGRRRYAERYHLSMLVFNKARIFHVDKRKKLFCIPFHLSVGQRHDSVQAGIRVVKQPKYAANYRFKAALAGDIHNPQFKALHYHLRQPLQPLVWFLRYIYQILYPIHILNITKPGKVFVIVRHIIIGDKHALSVKAFNKHALPVQVRKAKRTMNLCTVHLLCI